MGERSRRELGSPSISSLSLNLALLFLIFQRQQQALAIAAQLAQLLQSDPVAASIDPTVAAQAAAAVAMRLAAGGVLPSAIAAAAASATAATAAPSGAGPAAPPIGFAVAAPLPPPPAPATPPLPAPAAASGPSTPPLVPAPAPFTPPPPLPMASLPAGGAYAAPPLVPVPAMAGPPPVTGLSPATVPPAAAAPAAPPRATPPQELVAGAVAAEMVVSHAEEFGDRDQFYAALQVWVRRHEQRGLAAVGRVTDTMLVGYSLPSSLSPSLSPPSPLPFSPLARWTGTIARPAWFVNGYRVQPARQSTLPLCSRISPERDHRSLRPLPLPCSACFLPSRRNSRVSARRARPRRRRRAPPSAPRG